MLLSSQQSRKAEISLWVLVISWLKNWTVFLAIKMLLFSTQKVCLCAIFSRVRRAAYLYDFFFVISCMEKHNTYLFPHMGCSRYFGVSLLFKQTFSSRKMAITNSYYGRERPYTVFSVMAFFDTNYSLCRLWQKRASIVTNAAVWILVTFDYLRLF